MSTPVVEDAASSSDLPQECLPPPPPTASETETLLVNVLLASHKDLLRRRSVQSWRLHLLVRDLTSECARLWHVAPATGVPPSLYEVDVTRQLRALAVIACCREPFDGWLTLTLRSKRDQLEVVRPKLLTTQRSARVSRDRLAQLTERHSKLDGWIRSLSHRQSLRHALDRWRELSALWRVARGALANLARAQLRQWQSVAQALRRTGLPTVRRLRHRQYAAGWSAVCTAAAHEAWLATMRGALSRGRAFRQWRARRAELATARATTAVARRRRRRAQLARHLHWWRAALCATVRLLREGAIALAHGASTALWAARVRQAIRALHPSAIRQTRELDEAAVVRALRELGGNWAGGDAALRHVIDERRR